MTNYVVYLKNIRKVTNNIDEIKRRKEQRVLRALLINSVAQSITFSIAYGKLIHGMFYVNRQVVLATFDRISGGTSDIYQ